MAPGKARSGLSLADQLANLEDPTPKGMFNVIGLTYFGGHGPPNADLHPRFRPRGY